METAVLKSCQNGRCKAGTDGSWRTPAPTPMPTLAVASRAVLIPTKVTGFSLATFTAGVQQAYREAVASAAGGIDVAKVLLSNIRSAARRELASRSEPAASTRLQLSRELASRSELAAARRGLAAAAVDFDIAIAVADAAAATAMQATVAAVGPAELKVKLTAQLKAVQARGEFADIAGVDVDMSMAAVVVAPQPAVVVVVTGAPSPVGLGADHPSLAPTPALAEGSSELPMHLIGVGAALFAAALLLVIATRRRQRANDRQVSPRLPYGHERGTLFPADAGGDATGRMGRAQQQDLNQVAMRTTANVQV